MHDMGYPKERPQGLAVAGSLVPSAVPELISSGCPAGSQSGSKVIRCILDWWSER